jgi:hypothetical protein
MAAYTTINNSSSFMNTVLYTGNGSTQSITGVGFQPDFTWIKDRDGTNWNDLEDAVRGVTETIYSNATTAETTATNSVTAFGADGFSLGDNAQVNSNTVDYVGWTWKAGTTTGIAGSPSITPTGYSFNATSGFSIIRWVGTGANATLPHGLGTSDIGMILVKKLDSGGADESWCVYQHKNTSAPATDYLRLNSTAATDDNVDRWNDTLPTTSLFSIGTSDETNRNTSPYIAYCFAEIAGYSKFGSYVGNNGGTDGVFCYTGFKPALVIQKLSSNAGGNWYLRDIKRDTYNPMDNTLRANTDGVETDSEDIDFLSNGFKTRANGLNQQDSGYTYLYMAFAEAPFVNSNGVPCNAR